MRCSRIAATEAEENSLQADLKTF